MVLSLSLCPVRPPELASILLLAAWRLLLCACGLMLGERLLCIVLWSARFDIKRAYAVELNAVKLRKYILVDRISRSDGVC